METTGRPRSSGLGNKHFPKQELPAPLEILKILEILEIVEISKILDAIAHYGPKRFVYINSLR